MIGHLTGDHIGGQHITTGQDDGADHGHQQQHRCHLEGQEVIGEQVFTNAGRGFLTHGGRTGQRPGGGDHNTNQQRQQTGADAGGHQTSRGEIGDGLQVFPLVDEHDREQDQHVDRAHVHQDLGHGHETGVQQQVEPCNGGEHPAQQEGGINDVAEQHHTQGADHHNGGQHQKTDQLGGCRDGHASPSLASLEDCPSFLAEDLAGGVRVSNT